MYSADDPLELSDANGLLASCPLPPPFGLPPAPNGDASRQLQGLGQSDEVPPDERAPDQTIIERTRAAAANQLRYARNALGNRLGSRAAGYVESFDGWISQRVAEAGETYYRYSPTPSGSGSFVTSVRYATPAEARAALDLPPGNDAKYVQVVTITRNVLVFEGDVAGGTGTQTLLYNPAAAQFARGVPTG